MTAVAAVLPTPSSSPSLGIACYYLTSGMAKASKERTTACYRPFYDGLLEAMPAGARLIDGYEFAYPFKERRQFLKGTNKSTGKP